MKILVCVTCRTISELPDDAVLPDDSRHAGHQGVALEGDDLDVLNRVAVRHLGMVG